MTLNELKIGDSGVITARPCPAAFKPRLQILQCPGNKPQHVRSPHTYCSPSPAGGST